MPDFFTTFGAPGDSEHARPESDRGGADPMSLATDPATGAVIDEIAERFADQDEQRMRELNTQIRARKYETETKLCPCGCLAPLGHCEDGKPRAAPPLPTLKTFTLDPKPEETTMPCSKCGTDGHNARSCEKSKPAPKLEVKEAKPVRRAVAASPKWDRALAEMDPDGLIALRDAVVAEIRRRKNAAETALDKLNTALGEAA